MHPKDNLLRAYLDKELSPSQVESIRAHVAQCHDCQSQLSRMAERSHRVQEHLDRLSPGLHEQPYSAQAAYQRFTHNSRRFNHQKETIQTMFTRRPLWTALAVFVVLALVFTITPANAWASSFLSLFRVQKVQVVTFDPSAAENARTQLEANQAQIKQIFQDDLKITRKGSSAEVASMSEAAQKAGFTPRLPSSLANGTLIVRPGMNAVFTINQPKLQALIDATGANVQLPASVNGKAVTADVSSSVVATSAGCQAAAKMGETDAQVPENCTVLVQMPSPVVDTPAGLDVQQLGQAMFQFLGLSQAEAAQLSQRIDWTSTLILPIPQSDKIQYQDVQVDGVSGTFLQETGKNSYSLIWVKNGMLYGLRGPGGLADAQKVVSSLQ